MAIDNKIGIETFQQAELLEKRLKMLIWGKMGTGKTPLALMFPRPVILDLDMGSSHYAAQCPGLAAVRGAGVDSYQKVVDLIKWLKSNKHDFKTLIIDPVTLVHDLHIEKWNQYFLKQWRLKDTKNAFDETVQWNTQHWMKEKNDWSNFNMLLLTLDMNVISNARESDKTKAIKDASGKVEFINDGVKMDTDKDDDYVYDVVVRLENDSAGISWCTVYRDRTQRIKKLHEAPKKFKLDFKQMEEWLGKDYLEREVRVQELSEGEKRL